MISRRYSRKVRFFEEQEVADGYGGYVSQNVFLFESWAEVVTSAAGNRFQQFGISEFVNPVIFKIRKGNRVITEDRKSTRLNSSHVSISYAVFCLIKENN